MRRISRLILSVVCVLAFVVRTHAAASSVSAWDAANFRIWGFIANWATPTDINDMGTDGMYGHISDMIYLGGIQPQSDGSLYTVPGTTAQITALQNQSAAHGVPLQLSMFTAHGGTTDGVWEAIIDDQPTRNILTENIKNYLVTNNMKGFNFDWERPSTVAEWGNYTLLAKELGDKIHPLGMEVSVCDFGYPDTQWDASSSFDARVYDQLFIMGYNYTTSQNASFADQHNDLTQQGAAKTFTDDHITIGVGTYTEGTSTKWWKDIAAANPNMAYNAGSYTGTINGVSGTWTFESREQIRGKSQLAMDRGMPGVFSWTLHYDATDKMGMHRIMQHYAMVKRDVPDLDLDGKVSASDAAALADNIGSMLTNTGTSTAAQFDAFYMGGNWEKGDRDGNGYVNQADADWLAGKFSTLGVNLPDRLPYWGMFENFSNGMGLAGRWKAGRNAQNKLIETGNFKQLGFNQLAWTGTGGGAPKHSNYSVTIRNQNSTEVTAGVNSLSRTMQAKLLQNIDLNQSQDTYVTFLVRENTAPLTAAQLASSNRTLSLDFLTNAGASQFDFALRGLTHEFAIDSVADATGQDVSAAGFNSDAVYLFVGKISGNGSGANTMQASIFASGAAVADFTSPSFVWMLTAQGSAGFNPTITDMRFTSMAGANFTVSNVWVGAASALFGSGGGAGAGADFGSAVPEPGALVLVIGGAFATFGCAGRCRRK